jgi:hypothetical protein
MPRRFAPYIKMLGFFIGLSCPERQSTGSMQEVILHGGGCSRLRMHTLSNNQFNGNF